MKKSWKCKDQTIENVFIIFTAVDYSNHWLSFIFQNTSCIFKIYSKLQPPKSTRTLHLRKGASQLFSTFTLHQNTSPHLHIEGLPKSIRTRHLSIPHHYLYSQLSNYILVYNIRYKHFPRPQPICCRHLDVCWSTYKLSQPHCFLIWIKHIT